MTQQKINEIIAKPWFLVYVLSFESDLTFGCIESPTILREFLICFLSPFNVNIVFRKVIIITVVDIYNYGLLSGFFNF